MTEERSKEVRQELRTQPQVITGRVISDKMSKTRVVEVPRRIGHRLYGKNLIRSVKLMVHDEKNESKVGDLIKAYGCRPLSRHKSFRLVSIVEKAVSQ